MHVRAYAKINLTLDVLDRRPDGYHNISSVMQTISLHDSLDIRLGPPDSGIQLQVNSRSGVLAPSDETNLAYRAAQSLLHVLNPQTGVSIDLHKFIPAQAGLGGGSSDAAATLAALNELLDRPLTLEELVPLAANLGADVPFFLYGGTCRVEGIGERVSRLAEYLKLSGIIVTPTVGVSTADAYRAIDELRGSGERREPAPWDNLSLRNDFEDVIYSQYPAVERAREALADAGYSRTLLCGSGASVMGLDPAEDAETPVRLRREAAKAKIREAFEGTDIGTVNFFESLSACEMAGAEQSG